MATDAQINQIEVLSSFAVNLSDFSSEVTAHSNAFVNLITEKMSELRLIQKKAEEICNEPDGPYIYLDNIEVDFDDHLMYIFINGELKLVQQTEIKFKKTEQTLILCDKETNSQYSFDEIIINKSCIHTKDFDVDNKQLTKYSVKKPFIDFYFSGKDVKKGMTLSSVSQSGIRCVLCDNGNYYYYSTGAWRRARGSFEDTNDWATFTDKIKDYDYNLHLTNILNSKTNQ